MSALVWSVESVLIGLWALVLVSLGSSPFHTFIARTQLLVSGATLLFQLINTSRALPAAHAISEAYVCAVSGLFLMYVVVLLDTDNYKDPKLFALSVFGDFLPADACVGLGWFAAAFVSAIGMALSERGRSSKLMLHHFGYHMVIVPPSILIFWLYNYDGAASEPLSQAIQLFYSGARITHFFYTMVLIGIWGVFIVLQATGEYLQFEAEWPSFSQMTANGGLRFALSFILKLAGRFACVLIPFSATFTAKTAAQVVLTWALVGIGSLNAFDWLQVLDRFISGRGALVEARPLESSFQAANNKTFDPAALPLRTYTSSESWREKSV
jgi:hypothetical protein